jgi:hypothetical protein
MRRLLAIVLALFCLANAARAVLAAQQALYLPGVPTAISPGYLSATSAVWAVVFGACAYGIWRACRWAPRVTIAAIVLYQANLWLNFAAFARSPEAFERVGFAALLSAISIVFVCSAALWCQRKFARRAA